MCKKSPSCCKVCWQMKPEPRMGSAGTAGTVTTAQSRYLHPANASQRGRAQQRHRSPACRSLVATYRDAQPGWGCSRTRGAGNPQCWGLSCCGPKVSLRQEHVSGLHLPERREAAQGGGASGRGWGVAPCPCPWDQSTPWGGRCHAGREHSKGSQGGGKGLEQPDRSLSWLLLNFPERLLVP